MRSTNNIQENISFDKGGRMSNGAYAFALIFLSICVFAIAFSGDPVVALLITPFAVVALTVVFLFSFSAFKNIFATTASVAIAFSFAILFDQPLLNVIFSLAFIPAALVACLALKKQFRRVEFICYVSAVLVAVFCVWIYFNAVIATASFSLDAVVEYYGRLFDSFAEQTLNSFNELKEAYTTAPGGGAGSVSGTIFEQNLSLSDVKTLLGSYLVIIPALIVIVSNIVAFVCSSIIKFLSKFSEAFRMVPIHWHFHVGAFSAVLYVTSFLVYTFSSFSSPYGIPEEGLGILSYNIYTVLSVSFFAFGVSLIGKFIVAIKKSGRPPISPFFIIIMLVFCFIRPDMVISMLVSLISVLGASMSIWSAIINAKRNANSM